MANLEGFAFRGFRSFPGPEFVSFAPLSKINLFVGANNTGKSNILRIIHRTLASSGTKVESNVVKLRPVLDTPAFPTSSGSQELVAYKVKEVIALVKDRGSGYTYVEEYLSQFLQAYAQWQTFPALPEGYVWMPLSRDPGFKELIPPSAKPLPYASDLSSLLLGTSGGEPLYTTKLVLEFLVQSISLPGPSRFIEATRTISVDGGTPDLNGAGLIDRLLRLQNPAISDLADRGQFDAIESFVRRVLNDDSVRISIPHDRSTIHIEQDGLTLPVESLGTGVHEVIILAAACTLVSDEVVCLEEPEVHLHPTLQRQLLRYLYESTSNQYVIATHSAHMLDASIASVFRVTKDEKKSGIQAVSGPDDLSDLCVELGYRPSDIVQSNLVIWVEGPSDRIYLRHWIDASTDGRFIEGHHYSIMFYGGSLLAGLSPLDLAEVEEFISLRRLNRFTAVLIDSDKTHSAKKLNESKRRVIDGLNGNTSTGYAWVTHGYTIENYIPQALLDAAIREAHPTTGAGRLDSYGRWDNPLSTGRIGIKAPSKVAIAKQVVAAGMELTPTLKKDIQRLVELIHRANQHLGTSG